MRSRNLFCVRCTVWHPTDLEDAHAAQLAEMEAADVCHLVPVWLDCQWDTWEPHLAIDPSQFQHPPIEGEVEVAALGYTDDELDPLVGRTAAPSVVECERCLRRFSNGWCTRRWLKLTHWYVAPAATPKHHCHAEELLCSACPTPAESTSDDNSPQPSRYVRFLRDRHEHVI